MVKFFKIYEILKELMKMFQKINTEYVHVFKDGTGKENIQGRDTITENL